MNIKSVINELNKFSNKMLTTSPPSSESSIKKAEAELGLKLPNDYLDFIKTYNGINLQGIEVFGIKDYNNSLKNLQELYFYEHRMNIFQMPPELIPFSPDGFGNHYCFDSSKITKNSMEIIFWQSGYEYTKFDTPELVNSSFLEWLKEVVIDWTLEEYDYNGNPRSS